MPHIFLSHSSRDSEYVVRVASLLKQHVDVFYYEDEQRADAGFVRIVDENLKNSTAMVIFVGATYAASKYEKQEVEWVTQVVTDRANYGVVIVNLANDGRAGKDLPPEFPAVLHGRPILPQHAEGWAALTCAERILLTLGIQATFYGLPANPHIFSYEKDIIDFYVNLRGLAPPLFGGGAQVDQVSEHEAAGEQRSVEELEERAKLRSMILDGCPPEWPKVVDLSEGFRGFRKTPNTTFSVEEGGKHRPREAAVSASALEKYLASGIAFPEAGPRRSLVYPAGGGRLTVGIVVSGGIAPGINAVIDGVVQRHSRYAGLHDGQGRYVLDIRGYTEGLYALSRGQAPQPGNGYHHLYARRPAPASHAPNALFTSDFAHEGGSILGTHRLNDLGDPANRPNALQEIVNQLAGVDVLYVIGGDGSMKAAHALWTMGKQRPGRPLSVVAIPKTMDNDILWVWQAFGFLSAVEKARETVELLSTEVRSNPRLCVIQLFGSDSGFVVSHAVLASSAGHCQLALIPEVEFSMLGVARELKRQIRMTARAIPAALVVMAETAIPADVMCYLGDKNALEVLEADGVATEEERNAIGQCNSTELGLTKGEILALEDYAKLRGERRRIEGQTSDELRSAGLKVVKGVLTRLLPVAHAEDPLHAPGPNWDYLRVFSNEPRHLLRAIPPSTTDIITGQRLGMLAVDNAMAGYTDFMISQWLTEFVLVPLELVILGRKRIPPEGIFWKSVLAKTGQPANLVHPWPALQGD